MNTPNTLPKVKKGQQARDDFQLFRRSLQLAVPGPTLHADNPLLPPTADDTENQLPHQFQGTVLKVEIPAFDVVSDPNRPGMVYLKWDGIRQRLSQYPFTTPLDTRVFPIQLTLPAEATLSAGRHTLTYEVSIGGNPVGSTPLPIYIDQVAPNFGQEAARVTLPPEVEADGITKEYLDANGKVTVTVPEYNDKKIGDEISVYYGSNPQTALLVGTFTRPDTTTPVTVDLTTAQIGTSEGDKLLFYRLRDRVGNLGPESSYKPVLVTLSAAPIGLKPLTVPLAADGDVDIADANVGVQVQIEAYTNFVAGDQAVVTWGGKLLGAVPVTQSGPTFVTVPFAVLLDGNRGPKTVAVTYLIKRGQKEYPEPSSVDVDVDLRTPGPTNPDEPDPVNPDLALITVQAAVTAEANTVKPADAGQPATASVVIYENSKADDVVQLYWNNVAVPDSGDSTIPGGTYVVTGQEAVGFIMEFAIPWATIEAQGNGSALPVRYSIAHPAVNDAVVYSEDQPVEVSVQTVKLPAVLFLNLDQDFGYLNCGSLRSVSPQGWVVEISVAGGEPRLADQQLTFNYAGLNDATQANVTFAFTFTPTIEQATNGFLVYLPYDPPLIETRDGPGSITYTANVDGFPVTSDPHSVIVFMATAGAGAPTCELSARTVRR
ncbi:hypothetical protein [Pseudomonas huanghezhanensis]|uniref:hypothetical protein n=1 Tax=Pseudomonas huanghezhanensis TaxID=3002903 RepID=UPI002285655D|nr:hypothetical protein [Pseudomonas sp. BSw22131]